MYDELTVHLDDGRQLAGTSRGSADGRPVLFMAGAASGRSMGFGDTELGDLGIRLLTMDRPGMGASSEDPARSIRSTADDYRAFLSSVLRSDEVRVPVVANSQSSVFGLQAALDGWASRLVLVSPADAVADPSIRAMLPRPAADLAALVTDDPAAAERLLAAFGPEAMEEMVLSTSSEADVRIYSAPDFSQVYRRALREGFANDGAGYVRDTLLAMGPWHLALDEIEVPVTILAGSDDDSHSPDRAETLASRIPTARRRIVDAAGGSLLWTHAGAVLRTAIGASARGSRVLPPVPGLRLRPSAGPEEYPVLTAIWRSAVDATHGFLADADRDHIESQLPSDYLPAVVLTVAERDGRPVGFAGVLDGTLEMLFVDAAHHGAGIGTALLAHAIDEHGVTTVDVNEQNPSAAGFYARHGFEVVGRSDTDDAGRPYPLLHLRLPAPV